MEYFITDWEIRKLMNGDGRYRIRKRIVYKIHNCYNLNPQKRIFVLTT